MNNNKIQGSHRRLMGIPVPWVFVIVYLAGVGIEQIFPITIGPGDFLTIGRLLSILSLAVGALLAIMGAQWLFRKVHTTTDPNQVSSRLVISGPLKLQSQPDVQGPVSGLYWSFRYFQPFLACHSLAHRTGLLSQLVVIPVEENQLKKTFGETYDQYSSRVRRWI